MSGIQIVVIVISGVIMLSILKNTGSGYFVVAQCGMIVAVLFFVFPEVKSLVESLNDFGGLEFLEGIPFKVLAKTFGILTAGTITADICRDNGESALAGVVELSVKVLAVSCALPVISAVIKIAQAFLN